MAADDQAQTKVIVTPGQGSHAATRVHHRDLAEIRAEGQSPREAAEHLIHQLTRALDSALTDWRRDSIQQAIADVRAYADQAG